MSSFFHREAKTDRHGRPSRALPEKVRKKELSLYGRKRSGGRAGGNRGGHDAHPQRFCRGGPQAFGGNGDSEGEAESLGVEALDALADSEGISGTGPRYDPGRPGAELLGLR